MFIAALFLDRSPKPIHFGALSLRGGGVLVPHLDYRDPANLAQAEARAAQ